jgi:hypothetical protein
MSATLPQLGDRLPDLLGFVRTLARQIEEGQLQDGAALTQRFRDFSSASR